MSKSALENQRCMQNNFKHNLEMKECFLKKIVKLKVVIFIIITTNIYQSFPYAIYIMYYSV